MASGIRSSSTCFLNVDLDIYSRSDLRSLVEAFGKKVIILHIGRYERKYCAHLEICAQATTADFTIREFCRLIRALPKGARAVWNSATVRSFSIGIQAGAEPNACDFVISPKTVKAVSDLAGQIVLTIYGAKQSR